MLPEICADALKPSSHSSANDFSRQAAWGAIIQTIQHSTREAAMRWLDFTVVARLREYQKLSSIKVLITFGLALGLELWIPAPIARAQVIVKNTDQSTQSILEYWTESRINSASPTPLVVIPDKAPKNIKVDKNARPIILRNPKDVSQADRLPSPIFARTSNPADVTASNASPNGKLFYVNGGVNWVCSAAAVDHDLILTAAHCAYNRDNHAYSSNIVFAPDYSPKGSGPLLVVSQQIVPGDWVASGYKFSDQAIMRVTGNISSTYGIALRPTPKAVLPGTAFGYPAETPFPGNQLYSINPVEPQNPDPSDKLTIAIFSDMTGGSSGGPWVGSVSGHWGYIFGINSYKFNNDPTRMYSPYFWFVMRELIKCADKPIGSKC